MKIVKIIDLHTKKQIGKDYTYKNRNKARARANRLDLDYGAYKYVVKIIDKKEVLK